MPLEHRRSKDIQPENTSPQPSDPIREKDREQTLIPNEKEALYRVNSYDRKITKVGEYERSNLTSKEINELTSYNRKKRRNARNKGNNKNIQKDR